MKRNYASTLIIAKPGHLSDGLRSLLAAIPQIGAVEQTSDSQSALRLVEEHCPNLVLLDFDLLDIRVLTALRMLKHKCPESRYLVMAHDVGQQQEARDAGADAVVLVGTAPWELASIVTQLYQDYPGP